MSIWILICVIEAIIFALIMKWLLKEKNMIVFVEDDNIEYMTKYDESNYEKLASTLMNFNEDSYEYEIETAKKEAIKGIPDDVTLDYQEVTKILDKDLNPILAVKTAYVDAQGGRFVLDYEYSLK